MTERVDAAAIDLDQLFDDTASADAGAVVVFGGTVRRHHAGQSVTDIEYSAYAPLAERALATVESEALSRFDIISCAIRHRTGRLAVGELSVVVVVRAAHRAEAFDAARFAIDRLKATAPVWKRETYADGSQVYQQGETLPGAGESVE
ncbi:hypothetical protein SPICUR_00230 [Spiribacter curvatus]|uniref:Molybdopterin synthase catalytic subunit n=1 Tax=Spiribacter curvatus TaxID=1335757 RepID=U5T0Y2_9GAMM|nr:molybdenum cofactor biosynthesis protein MoaE [Spiribacter curvatus]AGY91075.1 hypothetical protein SPICUR_00230 [Spiribacter curvatus]